MLSLIDYRTQEDVSSAHRLVQKVKQEGINSLTDIQKQQYLSGLLGCYTYIDMNRVMNAYIYINAVLLSMGYNSNITTRVYTNTFIINEEERDIYINNLKAIRNSFFTFQNTPVSPNDYRPFQNANVIEKILIDIDNIIDYTQQNYIFCGFARCEQNRMWQQRFRRPKTWISQLYKFNQYLETDLISMITTDSGKTISGKTDKLELAQIDKRDDLWASIEAINNSMTIIDTLVGGAV